MPETAKPLPSRTRTKSKLHAELVTKLAVAGLPEPQQECRQPWAGTGRQFRADLCWPDARLIVEVDGGTWVGGRHTTGAGYARDCVKANLAVLAGWRVVRVVGAQVRDGLAVAWVRAALAEPGMSRQPLPDTEAHATPAQHPATSSDS